MNFMLFILRRLRYVCSAIALLIVAIVHADTYRVVTWNVNLDTSDYAGSDNHATQLSNIVNVLEGIGSAKLNDDGTRHAQSADIIALQELPLSSSGNYVSYLSTIVSGLNSYYGAGTYAYVAYTDPTTGGTGGGPSGLIYNTTTVSITNTSIISPASGSGAPRAPLQYTVQPKGYGSNAAFYVDVSHMKSGTDSESLDRRAIEAAAIANSVSALGSNAHVIALGDFNMGSSSEEAYTELTSSLNDVSLEAKGLSTWTTANSTGRKAIANLLTYSPDSVYYRDDIQFVSDAAQSDSGIPGLQYVDGSYLVFGNGGSTALVGQSIDSSYNTSVFAGLGFTSSQISDLLDALLGSSDHLPVVADYEIVGISKVPEPATLMIFAAGFGVCLMKRKRRLA